MPKSVSNSVFTYRLMLPEGVYSCFSPVPDDTAFGSLDLTSGLLRDPAFVVLPDSQKGVYMSALALACDTGGIIPGDPNLVKKLVGCDAEPDFALWLDLSLLKVEALYCAKEEPSE